MKFLKIRNVKNPCRNELENAGIDFYIPENDLSFIEQGNNLNDYQAFNGNGIRIPPYKDVKIPIGIKSKFPNHIALVAKNKSGICVKKKLIVGACVIDSSYQGEIIVHLINTSSCAVNLDYGTKCVQFVPFLIDTSPIEISEGVSSDEFFGEKTARGEGAFGSTGI